MTHDSLQRRAEPWAQHAAQTWQATSVEESLVAMMDRYERPLYTYLLGMLRDPDVAQDCAQETFLRAYDALRVGKVLSASWLYTVARNLAIAEFRRKKRFDADADALGGVPAPEQSMEGRLDVQDVMDRLPRSDREVLYFFEVAGFTTDEIGTMLGVRGSAIRQRLKRARDRFRALYARERE